MASSLLQLKSQHIADQEKVWSVLRETQRELKLLSERFAVISQGVGSAEQASLQQIAQDQVLRLSILQDNMLAPSESAEVKRAFSKVDDEWSVVKVLMTGSKDEAVALLEEKGHTAVALLRRDRPSHLPASPGGPAGDHFTVYFVKDATLPKSHSERRKGVMITHRPDGRWVFDKSRTAKDCNNRVIVSEHGADYDPSALGFASLDELLLNVSEFEAGMVQRGKEAVDADLLTHSS